jgi:hypothetical protein
VAAQAAGLEAALRLDRPPLHPSLAEDARALTIDAGRWMPPGSFRPALWWTASRALEAAGCPIEAAGAAQAGRAWIRRSLVKVPAPWRDSFLHRNAVVAALRACKGVAGAE